MASYLEHTGQPWDVFRQQLISAIAAPPKGRTYYESFTAAFEALLVVDGVLPAEGTDRLR